MNPLAAPAAGASTFSPRHNVVAAHVNRNDELSVATIRDTRNVRHAPMNSFTSFAPSTFSQTALSTSSNLSDDPEPRKASGMCFSSRCCMLDAMETHGEGSHEWCTGAGACTKQRQKYLVIGVVIASVIMIIGAGIIISQQKEPKSEEQLAQAASEAVENTFSQLLPVNSSNVVLSSEQNTAGLDVRVLFTTLGVNVSLQAAFNITVTDSNYTGTPLCLISPRDLPSDRLPMMSRADMSWAMAYQSAAIVRSVTRVNASSLPRTKPVRMVRGTVSLFNTQLTCVLLVFVNELRDPPVVHAALHMEPPSLWDPLRKVAGLVGSTCNKSSGLLMCLYSKLKSVSIGFTSVVLILTALGLRFRHVAGHVHCPIW